MMKVAPKLPKLKTKTPRQLAWEAIEAIEADPKHWKQDTYRCRTGHCFAGFVVAAAGGMWMPKNGYNDDGLQVVMPNGERASVDDMAEKLLGGWPGRITSICNLFDADNSLPMLIEGVTENFGRRPRKRAAKKAPTTKKSPKPKKAKAY